MRQIDNPNYVAVKQAATPEDRRWLEELWLEEWGGATMVVSGQVYELASLYGFIGWLNYERVGAATAHIHENGTCELMSINATTKGRGVGTIMLQEVERFAVGKGCTRIRMITTNDNLDALKFYQKRGYRLTAVYAEAVDEARKIKPQIPLIGNHGIPLHDELELAKPLL